MLIDTHCHLNFSVFNKNREEIIDGCLKKGLQFIIVGTNLETSRKAVEISQEYPKDVYSAVGLHPMELDTGLVKIKPDPWEGLHSEKGFNYEEYKKLAQSSKVVAIGEIGLDYYIRPKTTRKKELFKQRQKELLLQELKLAKELNLPVIFHCRMANSDLINILKNTSLRPQKAVIHSFVGTREEMEEYLSLGYYIGFNGIIFKTIEGIDFSQLIKDAPLERILLETDSPYLKPSMMVGELNTPEGVEFVAQRIAEIKNLPLDKISAITSKNAQSLFNLEKQ